MWQWIEGHVAGNGPIRRVEVVDVRQSMANGGGPPASAFESLQIPTAVDPRFLVDSRKARRYRRGGRAATGRSRSRSLTSRTRRWLRISSAQGRRCLDTLALPQLVRRPESRNGTGFTPYATLTLSLRTFSAQNRR